MLCFAAMTIEKAEIFMPKYKSKMHKFFWDAPLSEFIK